MKTSHKQTMLTKAARFVTRNVGHGQTHVVGAVWQAVRRYRVNMHELWQRIQSTDN